MMNDPYGSTVVVDGGKATVLDPVDPAELVEDWLQELLDASPGVLPVEVVDERVQAPLVSLGREISPGRGSIDILAISANGMPVIIETKLWRNHQARREVVAQILDYAGQVRQWGYEDLDELARRKHSASLHEVVAKSAGEALPEQVWVDRVSRNLRKGRMCLLIVGDGIREEATELAAVVGGQPDFEFRLGLVSLRVHQLDNERRLVVPQVAMRTTEIVRAIVQVEGGADARVTVATPREDQPQGREALTEDEFFESMRDNYSAARVASIRALLAKVRQPLAILWQPKTVVVGLAGDNEDDLSVRLVSIPRGGNAYVFLPWLSRDLAALLPDDSDGQAQIAGALRSIFERFSGYRTAQQDNLDTGNLAGREAEFVGELEGVAKRIQSSRRVTA